MKPNVIFLTCIIGWFPTCFVSACNVILLGDSISSGYGITPTKSWATLLDTRLKSIDPEFSLINLSVSGYTSAMALDLLSKKIDLLPMDLVIIELGGNDGLQTQAPELFEKNMNKIITLVKNKGATPVILGIRLPMNLPQPYRESHQAVYVKLLKLYPGTLMLLKEIAEKNLFQPDQIHPNVSAQSILLDNAWPGIVDGLKIAGCINQKME